MTPAIEADLRLSHPIAGVEARNGLTATVVGATLIALAVFLAFLALAHLSLRTDRAALAAPISAAFAERALDPQAGWQIGDTGIGAHQYNDCLILFQTLDDRAPKGLRAVSPLSAPVDIDNVCGALRDFAAGRIEPPTRHYHQYLHAHTTLARLLLPSLGVSGLRGLYKLALTLTLLAGLGYALLGLAQGRRMAEHAAWLAVFLAFSRWFGLESFGQSLGHGPADLVALAFPLFLLRASADTPITPRTAVTASALFGALTIQFEFLTGGAPLGLAIVIGALPLALSRQGDTLSVLIRSVLAYVAAIVATVMAKLALIALAFDPAVLIGMGRQFVFRTGLSRAAVRDRPIDGAEFVDHIWAGLEALAPGMHALAFSTLLLAIVAGAWGHARLRTASDRGTRLRAATLFVSMSVPPLWIVAFWQHSAEHAWFMDRILVWVIAAGGALFASAITERANGRTAETDRTGAPLRAEVH